MLRLVTSCCTVAQACVNLSGVFNRTHMRLNKLPNLSPLLTRSPNSWYPYSQPDHENQIVPAPAVSPLLPTDLHLSAGPTDSRERTCGAPTDPAKDAAGLCRPAL